MSNMKQDYLLDQNWQLFEAPLSHSTDQVADIENAGMRAFHVTLPCDVHVPLIEAGIIPEPLEGLQTDDCLWVEDRSWWFVNRFTLPEGFLDADRVGLSLDRLDTCADIFLNGHALGHHRNAFRPFETEVLSLLQEGENCLVIRLTAGHETVTEEDLGFMIPFVSMEGDRSPRPDHARGDWRRIGLRKPQYVYGWDWGPRLVTCGMGGPVKLVAERLLAIRSVQVRTKALEWATENTSSPHGAKAAHLLFDLEVETFPHISTCEGEISLMLTFGEDSVLTVQKNVCLRSGWNGITLETCLENPHLWWPNGMGNPDLYTAHLSVTAKMPAPYKGTRYQEACATHPPVRFGVRTIALDESPLADTLEFSTLQSPERRFQLCVNDETVFCKGGNWIPSDSLYLRIPDSKYKTLVGEAALSGYNMLRIWGGGFYETDLFHDLCDENGLMVWQDLMFACAAFPDHLDWFRQECAAEIEYQAVRLRNHACMVLWSGNNEIHSAFDGWYDGSDVLFPHGGMKVWNYIAPKLLHHLTPDIPYWNSSPYGGFRPGEPGLGDVHHWGECMMNPEMEKRISPTEFDAVTAKFVSEYGYIGPCRLSSIQQYHGSTPVLRDGPIWLEHNNTFEKHTVLAGIQKHYLDPDTLDMEEYLLYAGLCQGLMYGYSLEALRAKPCCAGAVYWMYNDTWGETGWTTIDYYLQRKVSFPFVRLAFAPVKLILRELAEAAPQTPHMATYAVTGINETTEPISSRVAYGFCRFDGSSAPLPEKEVTIPPRSRSVLFTFEVERQMVKDLLEGLVIAAPTESTSSILPATDSCGEFRNWHLPTPKLTIDSIERTEDSLSFTVSSNVYAHAVHFGLDERIRLSDEYFDLLPGEYRRIHVESGHEWVPDILPVPGSISLRPISD